MRASVCLFTLSNIFISETNRLIEIKFHLEHHWGGGKAALGFWPDWITILVSMAIDSSHRVLKTYAVNFHAHHFCEVENIMQVKCLTFNAHP